MSLTSGTRLGPYEVVAPLGAGGMGEVYRARDTELKREVALKVLPAAFTTDPDRLARFQREAELLATLNHPHIASIYGLHRDAGATALVLELVEGETLADRIARGPIPGDEARRVATQIAAALAAAHERGIIHRDLKPANIKIRPDGTVKVLDFGLAKALDAAPTGAASMSPTITSPAMTHAGVILGTAAYMSPEQARGQTADARSDIWAFGCVLFEMVTGDKAFPGDTVPEALASVLRAEPEWSQLPADTTNAVRRLLRRCLQKDRARRLADIRDAALELEEVDESPARRVPEGRLSRRRERWLWSGAVAALAIVIATLPAPGRNDRPEPREDHSYLDVPATTDPTSIALSPDGRQVIYVASLDGRPQLWIYSFETGERRPLRGTAHAVSPFWSPDSRSIGYFTSERLYAMELDGGAPRELAFAAVGTGGTWNPEDVILFTGVPDGAVNRPGGEYREVLAGERFPQFLPDNRHYIYYEVESRRVYVRSLGSNEPTMLMDGVDAAAVVAPPDSLLFVRSGELWVQQLDLAMLRPVGKPRSIAKDISVDVRGGPALSASAEGSVLFRTGPGDQPRRLMVVNRQGAKINDIFKEPDASFPMNPDLCPGAEKAALNRTVGGDGGIYEVELNRGIPTRLTESPRPEIVPICSPRGIVFADSPAGASRIARLTDRKFATVVKGIGIPLDEAPDGTLLYRTLGLKPATGWDIYAVEPGKPPRVVLNASWDERGAQFSPDGKWFAYESNEDSGVYKIFVTPYPSLAFKLKVSDDAGGSQPRWEGDEIFYIAPDGYLNAVRAVPSADGRTIKLDNPERLFPAQIESTVQGAISHAYAVFPGGKQFLLSTYTEVAARPLKLIRNLRRQGM
jgi:serine/threonine protein kinase